MEVTLIQDPTHPMATEFPKYLMEYQQLEQEYQQIPSWRTFKLMRNIKKRQKLTKAYTKKMKEWGIL